MLDILNQLKNIDVTFGKEPESNDKGKKTRGKKSVEKGKKPIEEGKKPVEEGDRPIRKRKRSVGKKKDQSKKKKSQQLKILRNNGGRKAYFFIFLIGSRTCCVII